MIVRRAPRAHCRSVPGRASAPRARPILPTCGAEVRSTSGPGRRSALGSRPALPRRWRHRAAGLAHGGLVWMRGTADHLHAARREVDHEARVIRHQPAPRPRLGREEIRASNRARMRPQKRAPRGRARGHRRNALLFQDPGDRRSRHTMAHVLQGTADPGVTPGWILFGHPHDPSLDLLDHPRASAPPVCVGPLPCDEVPRATAESCLASQSWPPASTPRGPDGAHAPQPASLIIREPRPSAAQLDPHDAMLFHPDTRSRLAAADSASRRGRRGRTVTARRQ